MECVDDLDGVGAVVADDVGVAAEGIEGCRAMPARNLRGLFLQSVSRGSTRSGP